MIKLTKTQFYQIGKSQMIFFSFINLSFIIQELKLSKITQLFCVSENLEELREFSLQKNPS